MLTRSAKYAIKALAYLARQPGGGDPVRISDIARDEIIPRKFLERILLQLNRDGFLYSRRGPEGGYTLAKPARSIMLGDLIRRIDGPLAPIACVSVTAYRPCMDCADESSCGIRLVMKEVRDAIANILDHTSLADMQKLSDAVKSALAETRAAAPKQARSRKPPRPH
ncbi:MAG: Rrf2 family transcriptional regulator [Kiritimatiellia bacterium]